VRSFDDREDQESKGYELLNRIDRDLNLLGVYIVVTTFKSSFFLIQPSFSGHGIYICFQNCCPSYHTA
jgi:hypothetical protein